MADKKIADLTEATTLSETDIFIVEDNANTKKMTKANLKSSLVNINVLTATILASGWTGTAPSSQSITVSGVVSGEVATVDIDLSSAADYAAEQAITEDWGKVYRIVASADNQITVYAIEVTTVNIPITIKVVR